MGRKRARTRRIALCVHKGGIVPILGEEQQLPRIGHLGPAPRPFGPSAQVRTMGHRPDIRDNRDNRRIVGHTELHRGKVMSWYEKARADIADIVRDVRSGLFVPAHDFSSMKFGVSDDAPIISVVAYVRAMPHCPYLRAR